MTKRDHDRLTQHDYGGARGDRRTYRQARGFVIQGHDYIATRAAVMSARNTPGKVYLDGYLPTLGAGSPYRNIAEHCASTGARLLSR